MFVAGIASRSDDGSNCRRRASPKSGQAKLRAFEDDEASFRPRTPLGAMDHSGAALHVQRFFGAAD
jgi:hypothetical protein